MQLLVKEKKKTSVSVYFLINKVLIQHKHILMWTFIFLFTSADTETLPEDLSVPSRQVCINHALILSFLTSKFSVRWCNASHTCLMGKKANEGQERKQHQPYQSWAGRGRVQPCSRWVEVPACPFSLCVHLTSGMGTFLPHSLAPNNICS